MKMGLVAIHYPHPPHYEEFISRVRQVVEIIRQTPGCLSADCWVTVAGDAVISTAQWESEEALTSSFAAAKAAGADLTYDERESRPRDVYRLVSS
jgi:quinol monooxygenase YgiN